MDSVCKDCTERRPACWGECPKYQAARAEHEKVKKAAFDEQQTRRVLNSVQYHGLAKHEKNRRRKK